MYQLLWFCEPKLKHKLTGITVASTLCFCFLILSYITFAGFLVGCSLTTMIWDLSRSWILNCQFSDLDWILKWYLWIGFGFEKHESIHLWGIPGWEPIMRRLSTSQSPCACLLLRSFYLNSTSVTRWQKGSPWWIPRSLRLRAEKRKGWISARRGTRGVRQKPSRCQAHAHTYTDCETCIRRAQTVLCRKDSRRSTTQATVLYCVQPLQYHQ